MKRNIELYQVLSTALLIFGLLGCYKDKAAAPECATTISYKYDIDPILEQSCVSGATPIGCHDLWAHHYDGVLTAINLGTFQSTIFDLKSMPKIPNDYGIDAFTEDELQTIRCWLNQGYPDN